MQHWFLAERCAISMCWHAIPAHIRSQARNLALRGLVTVVIAMKLTTLLWRRRADNDHQNVGCGVNHATHSSTPLALANLRGKYSKVQSYFSIMKGEVLCSG